MWKKIKLWIKCKCKCNINCCVKKINSDNIENNKKL